MKKLLLFPLFFLFTIIGLRAQAGAFTLCPVADPSEMCACATACFNAGICSPASTGSCSNTTPNSTVISVPAGQDVTVDITRPMCSANGGMDGGDSWTVGSTTMSGGSNTTPTFTGCLATGGTASTFIIEIDTDRKDECIDVVVTFTPNGGTPGPTCEQLSAALPIELISFDAKIKNDIVSLKWSTASEIDNDYFEIQHSTDGRVFNSIDKMKGQGTTFEQQNYSFEHKNPSDGPNYYRLKQIDFDEKFDYSNIVSIDYRKSNSWRLFPTQSNDGITVDWSNNFSAEAISIYNINGKMIHFETIDTDIQQKYISTQNFPSGTYFLKMQSGRSVSTKRFYKIN